MAFPDSIFTPGGSRPGVVAREMTVAEIRSTVADFAAAVRRAVDAGFEGVEVHGGNGYLIHQFLSEATDHRADAYGGSAAGRSRFAVEVVEAVADAIGPARVGLRIRTRCHGLPAAGADLISLGRAFLANPDLIERFRRGAPLNPVRPEHWYGGGELGYTDYPVLAAAEERDPAVV